MITPSFNAGHLSIGLMFRLLIVALHSSDLGKALSCAVFLGAGHFSRHANLDCGGDGDASRSFVDMAAVTRLHRQLRQLTSTGAGVRRLRAFSQPQVTEDDRSDDSKAGDDSDGDDQNSGNDEVDDLDDDAEAEDQDKVLCVPPVYLLVAKLPKDAAVEVQLTAVNSRMCECSSIHPDLAADAVSVAGWLN